MNKKQIAQIELIRQRQKARQAYISWLLYRQDEDGRWITVNGTPIHLNEKGEADRGPSAVKEAINKGTSKSGKKSSSGESAKADEPIIVNSRTGAKAKILGREGDDVKILDEKGVVRHIPFDELTEKYNTPAGTSKASKKSSSSESAKADEPIIVNSRTGAKAKILGREGDDVKILDEKGVVRHIPFDELTERYNTPTG